MKLEAASGQRWIKYSSKHCMQRTQALRARKDKVILERDDGQRWKVDLEKMEQKPVVKRFVQYTYRKVRKVYLDYPSS